MHIPQIAIVDANTLSCMGLQAVIERLIPLAEIHTFPSFAALSQEDGYEGYFHYFVSLPLVLEHRAFFGERLPKTIVLVNGVSSSSILPKEFHVLDISQPEELLIKQILKLHQSGHGAGHGHHPIPEENSEQTDSKSLLSRREIEVLILVVKGFINKEIADKLNISLPTVISHRKNITEKLGIKSVSALTIYAVMHGYVEASEI